LLNKCILFKFKFKGFPRGCHLPVLCWAFHETFSSAFLIFHRCPSPKFLQWFEIPLCNRDLTKSAVLLNCQSCPRDENPTRWPGGLDDPTRPGRVGADRVEVSTGRVGSGWAKTKSYRVGSGRVEQTFKVIGLGRVGSRSLLWPGWLNHHQYWLKSINYWFHSLINEFNIVISSSFAFSFFSPLLFVSSLFKWIKCYGIW